MDDFLRSIGITHKLLERRNLNVIYREHLEFLCCIDHEDPRRCVGRSFEFALLCRGGHPLCNFRAVAAIHSCAPRGHPHNNMHTYHGGLQWNECAEL